MNVSKIIVDGITGILQVVLGLVNNVLPMNFIMDNHIPELAQATYDTLVMTLVSGFIALLFGLLIGIVSVVTRPKGILQQPVIYFITDKLVNIFRSIPFVILIGMLYFLTRALMGTALGVQGSFVPLVFGATPFFARQIEAALLEVSDGVIEASQAMGLSPMQIIVRVYLKESIPSMIRGINITFILVVGLTAMAGQVGGGGLGNFAIRYGYDRPFVDAIYVSLAIILLIVSAIQGISNVLIKKTTH